MKARSALIAAVTATVIVPASAQAATTREAYVKYPTTVKSGPTKCNFAGTLQIGPANAKNVVVLIPGFLGGSGDFRVIGRRLVKKYRNLAVWGIDRRSQCLEDTTGFDSASTKAKDAQGYYITGKRLKGKTFVAPKVGDAGVEAARGWGLATTLSDIHDVVAKAKSEKVGRTTVNRNVILGGHSLGGSLTDLYAVWDFNGKPGYEDVKGLLLIDGGARGTFGSLPAEADTTSNIAGLATGMPFAGLVPGLDSYLQGVFVSLGARYALQGPTKASGLQGLLKVAGLSAFTTDGTLTNDAQLGYAFDADTSPSNLALLRFNMGGLKAAPANPATPRGWTDGGLTDLKDVKTLFGSDPGNFVEWYFPKRLTIDVGAANGLAQTAFTDGLVDASGSGMKLRHVANVNIPLYAFETGLTCSGSFTRVDAECGVIGGAKSFVGMSKITDATYVADHAQEHLDPLVARPATDKFAQTAYPFIKRILNLN